MLALALATLLTVAPSGFGLFDAADPSYTINAAFSPDGTTVYYSKSQPGWNGLTIFESHRTGDSWSAPEVAPFSGIYRDTDPAVTPDGDAVIFASTRPPKGSAPYNYALFIAYIKGPKKGTVEPLPDTVNSEGSEVYPSIARDGTLYFLGGTGRTSHIYRAALKGGTYQTPQPIAFPGDGPATLSTDPTISADQRFIVFSGLRPDTKGGRDLYVSFRNNDTWCAPIHIDAPVNGGSPAIATGLSPDGRTLFFASGRSDLVQPRAARADAAAFRDELTHSYQNGALRTFRVDNFGTWLDAQPQRC